MLLLMLSKFVLMLCALTELSQSQTLFSLVMTKYIFIEKFTYNENPVTPNLYFHISQLFFSSVEVQHTVKLEGKARR